MRKPDLRLRNILRLGRRASGVGILEMIIALSLGMIVMSSLFSLYYGAAKGAAREENRATADRTGRLIADHLSRDFRLVGAIAPLDCNGDANDIHRDVPFQTWSDSIRQDFEYANTYSVVFTGDIDNDSTTETVRFYLDNGTHILTQETWKWSRDSVKWRAPKFRNLATHVDFLMFRYYDRDGNTIPNPVTFPVNGYTLGVGERVRVTEVEITVVTKSDHADNKAAAFLTMPDGTYWHDRYTRDVQRFVVRSRNLSLGA